jgi:hypothetical protein
MPRATATPTAPISIARLAETLGINRMYLSGLLDGMGIETVRGEKNSKAIPVCHIPEIERTIQRLTAVKCG